MRTSDAQTHLRLTKGYKMDPACAVVARATFRSMVGLVGGFHHVAHALVDI